MQVNFVADESGWKIVERILLIAVHLDVYFGNIWWMKFNHNIHNARLDEEEGSGQLWKLHAKERVKKEYIKFCIVSWMPTNVVILNKSEENNLNFSWNWNSVVDERVNERTDGELKKRFWLSAINRD